jgi:acetyl esterase/lipase
MKNSTRTISISVIISSLLIFGCAYAEQSTNITKSLAYNTHGQLLDVYVPQARDKKTAIMFIHGGGFKEGSKEQMAGYAALYAKGGFVTTSINYRLTPNHVFPKAINDTKDALQWMKDNAEMYGYDPSKIVLVGYSTGGTLALNVGLADDTGVAAVISGAGATDIGLLTLTAPRPQLRSDLATYMAGQPPRLASPIFQVSQNDPPVFLFHRDKDDFVPVSQAVSLATKLEKNNVPMLLRVFPNAGHEIMLLSKKHNAHLKQLLDEMTRFILAVE